MSDPFLDSGNDGLRVGRGGFLRGSNDAPWVSDPDGRTSKHYGTKSELLALCCARGIEVPDKITVAGLQELLGVKPKMVPFGSPSNRSKLIENTTNLTKHGERLIVGGIGVDPELAELCAKLVDLEQGSDEYKRQADSIVARAKDVAKANLAADRGSHTHALSEDSDTGRNWLRLAEEGELLGISRDVQAALVDAWNRMLIDNGIEILAVEASCVDDDWRLAGTLDRIGRTTRDLRFALPSGEIVVIPAGEVLVLDIKSGRKRTERNGAVIFWHGYAIQIASYAQSKPYDTTTHERGEWPWKISQEHALIAHLDVLAAMDGNATCELVYVDLVAGREHGGAAVVLAKSWEDRSDVFSVAQIPVTPVPVAPSVLPSDVDAAGSSMATPTSPKGGRASRVQSSAGTPVAADEAPEPVPAPAPVPSRTPADEQAIVRSRPAPDEGDEVDDVTFGVLEARYKALAPVARSWVNQLASEATRGGVPFHSKDNHTRRRWEILRALVILAEQAHQ